YLVAPVFILSPAVLPVSRCPFLLFFFNAPATTEIYTLSLHDALPISPGAAAHPGPAARRRRLAVRRAPPRRYRAQAQRGLGLHRSEEHTSELQSRENLVCRLLLEKKKKKKKKNRNTEK